MDSPFVSVAEAAALLGVSTATLRNWDRRGKLTPRRHPVNKYRMYARHELDALVAQTSLLQPEPRPAAGQAAPDARAIRRLVARLHNVLRDNDSQSNIVLRFDEITKLVFAKAVSDRTVGEAGPPLSRALGDANAVREYYARLAAEHSALVPPAFASLKCSDAAVRQCVEALEMVSFSTAGFDVKGVAYEEVVRNTFDKSDHQQFFTPPQVTEFIVSAMEPDVRGAVCDPACGTGGFLASIARRDLPYETLTGMEIDERLAWVAGVNMFLHGARGGQALLLPGGGTLGRAAEAHFGRFDAILTNPPFGSDLADPELLNRMALGAGRPGRRRGILFVERCWDLLKPGGALAIVIDEGVLNLPHAEDVRGFILDRFDVSAVVSLPESTFQPYATVNASIMLLRKRPPPGPRATPVATTFFARAEHVGRKPNGDDDVRYARDGRPRLNSDLPEILRAWREARAGGTGDLGAFCYVADVRANHAEAAGGLRLDYQFHHPSRQDVRRRIEACAYPLVPLHALCAERTEAVVPARDLAGTTIPYTGLAQIEARDGRAVQEPTPADSLKSQVRPYEAGDILFARMRPNLRKVALVDFEEPGYTSPECAVLVVKNDASGQPAVDPLALSVLLRSDFIYGQIAHLVAGIGRPRISQKQLRDVLVPLPPREAQAAIRAAYLEARAEAARLEEEACATLCKAREVLAGAVAAVAEAFAARRREGGA